jgi:hypothetical protein
MKLLIMCMCLGLSLSASDVCDTYLKQADDARIELWKILAQDSPFSSNDKIKIFLKYVEILQDRYVICKQYNAYDEQ